MGAANVTENVTESNAIIDGSDDGSKTQDAKIEYISNSYFAVTIPKRITLDGTTKQGGYSVKVSGDIASNQVVIVSARDDVSDAVGTNFYMKDISSGAKEQATADVTHSKKTWNYQNVRDSFVSSDNNVSAPNLTAGSWQGSLVFQINLKQLIEDDESDPKMSFLSEDGAEIPRADMSAFSVRMGSSRQMMLSLADDVAAEGNAIWESDNPSKIMADDGLIALTDEAQVGDTANISVSVPTTTDILSTSFMVTVEESYTYPLAPESAINNWNYTLDDANNIVTLNYYVGSETDVIVYGSYPINTSEGGRTYRTQLASNVENASDSTMYMFNGSSQCENIQSIKFSNVIDTSNVTDMSEMFAGCSSLTSLDVSGFDTSNVTDMSEMFAGCSSLTSLDVSGFDTSNVTDMSYMFYICQSLTSLDVSGFDTSNVTDMSYMFYICQSLTSLDVSGFDTSNVTDMSEMFYICQSLTSLDLSSFDTSNVTNMYYMFASCSSLTSLDLSSFDTSNVTNMNENTNPPAMLGRIE